MDRPRKTARRRSPRGGLHYITFSCYRRLPLLGEAQARDEFVRTLRTARTKHKFKLVAWVVMPEHVHLMLVPTAAARPGSGTDLDPGWPEDPGSPLPSILIGIKKPIAEASIRRWRAIPFNNLAPVTDSVGTVHYWQPGGGFDRNVRDSEELMREVRYVHQNPVKRGLVQSATDWPWSSARWYAGRGDALLPIDRIVFDRCVFPGPHPGAFVR
jgi:putative transposase